MPLVFAEEIFEVADIEFLLSTSKISSLFSWRIEVTKLFIILWRKLNAHYRCFESYEMSSSSSQDPELQTVCLNALDQKSDVRITDWCMQVGKYRRLHGKKSETT